MTLSEFARATYLELTLPLGGRLVMSRECYVALDKDHFAGSLVRALSRREVIARRARARKS